MNISNDTYLISGGHPRGDRDVAVSVSPLRARLQGVGAWWAEWRRHDREMAELHRFSDRELWDVGLSRSDIMSIENGTYRRG